MLLLVAVTLFGLVTLGNSHPNSKRDLSECPPGSAVAMCFSDPCLTSSCNVPGAACSPNFCGGCHAVWSDAEGNTLSPDSCRKKLKPMSVSRRDWFDECPAHVPIVHCIVSPCQYASCHVEGATCRANYCGGCTAEWFDADDRKIEDC